MYLCYVVDNLLSACKSDHSLRRQLETIASMKMNTAELHQSRASLSPVNASVMISCPLILIHLDKQFSTYGSSRRSKVKGDSGIRRPDVGNSSSGQDKGGSSSFLCPGCGSPCSRMQIFMCRLHFTVTATTA